MGLLVPPDPQVVIKRVAPPHWPALIVSQVKPSRPISPFSKQNHET